MKVPHPMRTPRRKDDPESVINHDKNVQDVKSVKESGRADRPERRGSKGGSVGSGGWQPSTLLPKRRPGGGQGMDLRPPSW